MRMIAGSKFRISWLRLRWFPKFHGRNWFAGVRVSKWYCTLKVESRGWPAPLTFSRRRGAEGVRHFEGEGQELAVTLIFLQLSTTSARAFIRSRRFSRVAWVT